MGVREIQVAGRSIIVNELDDLCDSTTGRVLTGSWVWNSALILAEWIVTQCRLSEFELQGKSVIELGAGAGLPGMTAALLGASRVVLTDIEALLPGLLKNVDANGLGDRVEVRELVWGSDKEVSQLEELGKFEIVLMSDVLFDAEEMGPLAHTLKIIVEEGARIWVASEVRSLTDECLNELMNQGFKINESPVQLGQFCLSLDENIISESFCIFHLELQNGESDSYLC